MLQDLEIRRSQVGRYAQDGGGVDTGDDENDDFHGGGLAGKARGQDKGKSSFKKTRFAPDVGRAGSAP
jgi:hypothetical protein